jgi:hypothetical protein
MARSKDIKVRRIPARDVGRLRRLRECWPHDISQEEACRVAINRGLDVSPEIQEGEMETQADRISRDYHDDGQMFVAVHDDGSEVELVDALRTAGGARDVDPSRPDVERWTLPDGSVITIAGDAWDHGYQDCWCWRGTGHGDECETVKAED